MLIRLFLLSFMAAAIEALSIGATSSEDRDVAESEPRGATYSYYYLGRRIWYVPLWFLFYFLFYIVGLIIRSISLHRIRPGHTELDGRSLAASSLPSSKSEVIGALTTKVMNMIELYQDSLNKEH